MPFKEEVLDLDGIAESGDHSDVADDDYEDDYDSTKAADERIVAPHQRSNQSFASGASSSMDEPRFVQPPGGHCKRKRTSASAEVADVMQLQRDACDVYGEHVAIKLKTYDRKTQAIVQHYINNVIFQADMGTLPAPALLLPIL